MIKLFTSEMAGMTRIIDTIIRLVKGVSYSTALKKYDRLINEAFLRRVPVAPTGARGEGGKKRS